MGNPDQDKTTINVKSVQASSWVRAKDAAAKADESMGAWLSRAADQLANLEAGDRLILKGNPQPVSGNPGNPVGPDETLAGLLHGYGEALKGLAALAEAGVGPTQAELKTLRGVVRHRARELAGMPQGPVRTRAGKAVNLDGQSQRELGQSSVRLAGISEGWR